MNDRANEEWLRRAVILLKAAAEVLENSDAAQQEVIIYDDAECDGGCLLDDIKSHLEFCP